MGIKQKQKKKKWDFQNGQFSKTFLVKIPEIGPWFSMLVAKDIDVTQLYGCEAVQRKLKNSLKTQKMHFLPVFELTSDSLMTI